MVCSAACQESYNLTSIEWNGSGSRVCPSIKKLREKINEDVNLFLNNFLARQCGCDGPGWKRVAYLNMSNPRHTCPLAWELINTPRRSCARPSNASFYSCYSAMFPTQGIQYSQVCGRIIGYQVGQPEAFFGSTRETAISGRYVDGVSLTYGSPRQHIWTFANALQEAQDDFEAVCPCTHGNEQHPVNIPSFIGNDYFCETGVPPGQNFNNKVFYADDPLWDGQGCGPTSTCCTFNNPPWFSKQLPQSTNADLEARLCSANEATDENTPIELIEIYVK